MISRQTGSTPAPVLSHSHATLQQAQGRPSKRLKQAHLPGRPPPAAAQATSQAAAVEPVAGLRADLSSAFPAALRACLTYTDLQGLGPKTVGKVRDTYRVGERLVVVTTDRQSAFDRVLAAIPFKGAVLNQTSAWWMARTAHLAPNALLATPHPNAAVMAACAVFPVEFVVRGFMTGSTDTSLWTHYARGERTYCGITFPDGIQKSDRLPENVVTPTTKAASHDVPISPEEIVAQGLMSREDYEQVSAAALRLFAFGQREAAARGLLLVDTKYEFGRDPQGEIRLVDELHTPDSSRYWLAGSYEERRRQAREPENIDKEFLRLWFRANCDPYADTVLPEAPRELVEELARRYVLLYERITGEAFAPPPGGAAGLQAAVDESLRALSAAAEGRC